MIHPNEQKMDALLNPAKNYALVFECIESGKIRHSSVGELTKHAEALCLYHYKNKDLDQVSAALYVQHLLLCKINKKATIFLTTITVIATLVGILQAGAAILAIYPELISRLGLPTPAHLVAKLPQEPTKAASESLKNSN